MIDFKTWQRTIDYKGRVTLSPDMLESAGIDAKSSIKVSSILSSIIIEQESKTSLATFLHSLYTLVVYVDDQEEFTQACKALCEDYLDNLLEVNKNEDVKSSGTRDISSN